MPTAEQPFSDDYHPDETAESVDKWIKTGGESSTGIPDNLAGLPPNVEYPLAFKVRDFLLEKGYALSDQSGRKIKPVDDNTISYGLLVPQVVTPSRLAIINKLRKIYRPSHRWIGVIHCEEKEETLIRVFGRNNIETLLDLSSELGQFINKNVAVRFSSEEEKREKRFF